MSSWKLSRNRELSDFANAAIDNIIANTQGLLQEYYIQTSQTDEDCFYLPEINESEPMIFRGQCEDVIGIQELNMEEVRKN